MLSDAINRYVGTSTGFWALSSGCTTAYCVTSPGLRNPAAMDSYGTRPCWDWAGEAPSAAQHRGRLLQVRRFAEAMQAEDNHCFTTASVWPGPAAGGGRWPLRHVGRLCPPPASTIHWECVRANGGSAATHRSGVSPPPGPIPFVLAAAAASVVLLLRKNQPTVHSAPLLRLLARLPKAHRETTIALRSQSPFSREAIATGPKKNLAPVLRGEGR